MIKVLRSLHRVLGAALSLLFVMWFLSGFVMLFHTFPSISPLEASRGLPDIPIQLSPEDSPLEALLEQIPEGQTLQRLSLRAMPRGEGYTLVYRDQEGSHTRYSDEGYRSGFAEAKAYAQRFLAAPILKVDTLYTVDTWVPYARSSETFPLYRFYYGDSLETELSVSQSTAEGIQLTTRDSRFWAYLGAIPHWIYLYQLRQHRGLWVGLITLLSALGFVMCLSGLWLGLHAFWMSRRRRGLPSPYKKWDYRWHHLLGLLFGLSVSGYIFSGLMSVQEVPQAIIKTEGQARGYLQASSFAYHKAELLGELKLLMASEDSLGVKSISWLQFGRQRVLSVTAKGQHYFLKSLQGGLEPLWLEEQDVRIWADSFLECPYQLELLEEYDNYYIDRHGELPLPVYRIQIADRDRTWLYLNPKTAEMQSYDKNTRLRRLLYEGLHSMAFAPLLRHPWLWWCLVLLCLTGGLLVSLTGLKLGIRYFRRRLR